MTELSREEKLSRLAFFRKQHQAALYDLVLAKRFAEITEDKARVEAVEKDAVKIQKVLDEIDKIEKELSKEG